MKGKSPQPTPLHGTNPGDKISGDSLRIECRKPGDWQSFRMSGQHNGFRVKARMNASAVVEQGFKNVRQ
jgi:hypothetical protein